MANIFLFKGNVKGKVVSVGGAMSFSLVIVAVLMGIVPRWRLVSFFHCYGCAFLFNRLGAFPFYCGKEDFGGYGMCFPLDALR